MNTEEKLERGLGLAEATALNMTFMVGIGPFVVIPFVVQAMGGPQCLVAWGLGAVLAVLDGCVWAELGSAMPHAGGSYVFLREAYGPARWGRLMSFLFIWQSLFQAPLSIASGALGFADYSAYLVARSTHVPGLVSPLGVNAEKATAGGVVLLVVLLLYRRITTIGKISVVLCVVVVGTILWLIYGGATHFDAKLLFSFPPGAWTVSGLFFAGLGHATIQTVYSYLGYYNVSNLGSEMKQPERNIPRAIFISIFAIAALYFAMQTSILSVVPWQQAAKTKAVVSLFVERIFGTGSAKLATALILATAFGSIFSATLGYSRVPYAAALDGNFFSIFARVHPQKKFPHVSLLALGAAALIFSVTFRLEFVIRAILAMRCLTQFMAQAVGLLLLRRRWPRARPPFRMWLYPFPVVMALAGWLAIFLSTGLKLVLAALAAALLGALLFLMRARWQRAWPFEEASG